LLVDYVKRGTNDRSGDTQRKCGEEKSKGVKMQHRNG
jgi:hypothetical protein